VKSSSVEDEQRKVVEEEALEGEDDGML